MTTQQTFWTIPVGKLNQPTPKQETESLSIIPTISKYNNIINHQSALSHIQQTVHTRSIPQQNYKHGIMHGSPPVAKLIEAIKNDRLATFPGLLVTGVHRKLPKSIVTQMGHLHKYRQNTRSTKTLLSVN